MSNQEVLEEFAEEDALTVVWTLVTNTSDDNSVVFNLSLYSYGTGIAVDTLGLSITNAASD